MLGTADQSDPSAPDRMMCGVDAAFALVRYATAWPIFVARETLAAWDDGLAFIMNMILGEDWQAVGFGEDRRSRRRPLD
jgi:hypothetical protein